MRFRSRGNVFAFAALAAFLASASAADLWIYPKQPSGLGILFSPSDGGDGDGDGDGGMTLAATPDFWWKLDEANGIVADNSGSYGTPSDYDATLFSQGSGGAYTWLGGTESWGSGGITGGIRLDNSSSSNFDAFDVANPLPLAGAGKVTIAYWAERATLVSDHHIFFQGTNYFTSGYQYKVGSQGGVNWRALINGGEYLEIGDYYPTGEKHHFVAVLDFSLSGGELAVYVDGGATPDFTFDVPGADIASMSGVIATIACSAGDSTASRDNPWDGKLADLRLWLDAATGAEANQIYLNTLGGSGVQVSASDAGAGSDVFAMLAGVRATETASGSDSQPGPVALIDAIDTGSGADAVHVLVTLALADSGSGAETLSLLQQLVVLAADAAAGSDAATLSVGLVQADSAVGVDGPLLSVSIGAGDTASAEELLTKLEQLLVSASDIAIAVDGPAILAGLSASDAGSGAELPLIFASVAVVDVGSGADAAQLLGAIIKTALDTGAGSDGLLLSAILTHGDAATGSDSGSVGIQIASTDAGAGADIASKLALVIKSIADSASGSDAVDMAVTLRGFDLGAADDLGSVAALMRAIEAAGGSDITIASDATTKLVALRFAFARRDMQFDFAARRVDFNLTQVH